ncbi:hypothetical protein CRX72_05095 [Pantoea sp. BRM17]|nr:hypothetical protein CRX72_05095 [Pantoea sp. BRM17]
MFDLILRRARLCDEQLVDIALRDGKIAVVGNVYGADVMMGAGNASGRFLGPLIILSAMAASIPIGLGSLAGALLFYLWNKPITGGAILGAMVLGAMFPVGILDIGGAIQTGVGLGVPALLLGAGIVFPVANFAASLVTGLVIGVAIGYVIILARKFTINQSDSTSFPIFVGLLSSGVFAGTHMYYLYGIGAFNEVAFVSMLRAGMETGVYGAVAAFGASFLFARIIEGSL